MVKKKLEFRPTAPVPLEENTSGASRDVWLAAWGVVAIFVIVILVMFFTGNLPAITGDITLVPVQNACQRGNAVTDLRTANQFIAAGGVCEQGLLPYIKCCWWP